jgi:hypothetical protein
MTAKKKESKKAKSKISRSSAEPETMVALTVKIDSPTYIRLSALRAKERKTAQNILEEALRLYLKSAGY